MSERKTGVWLIGAFGSVSAAVMLGALAMRKGLAGPTGMVTAGRPFESLDLVRVEELEFGGCDIRQGSLREAVRQIVRDAAAIDPVDLIDLNEDFALIERNIRPGTVRNCGEVIGKLAAELPCCGADAREEIDRVRGYIKDFKTDKGLHETVVVNLASTEPCCASHEYHTNLDALESNLDRNDASVPASTIYAYAAIQEGCPYINFTPSRGALFPAMEQLAERERVPVMGNDGKTGETLVKSALAPMFLCRNLEVMSWEGFNILGNMDGQVLDHPQNRESKIQSKGNVLSRILGYDPHSRVHIDYVPSLSDQKTAWDFIHFRGFLGSKMSLQFVWQGYDSLLAAPLVLDLARFAELAKRRGEAGLMKHLACYFKDPVGVQEHRLYEQYRMLLDYANPSPSPK